MKYQEEELYQALNFQITQVTESVTPDYSKINQLKRRNRLARLYVNSNPWLIYVYPIIKYPVSLNPNLSYLKSILVKVYTALTVSIQLPYKQHVPPAYFFPLFFPIWRLRW